MSKTILKEILEDQEFDEGDEIVLDAQGSQFTVESLIVALKELERDNMHNWQIYYARGDGRAMADGLELVTLIQIPHRKMVILGNNDLLSMYSQDNKPQTKLQQLEQDCFNWRTNYALAEQKIENMCKEINRLKYELEHVFYWKKFYEDLVAQKAEERIE